MELIPEAQMIFGAALLVAKFFDQLSNTIE
jgi:hypothetical protein